MEEFDNLKRLISEVEAEIAKVDEGNKAAGTRVRKQMQEAKKACQAIRDRILKMRQPTPPPPAPQA